MDSFIPLDAKEASIISRAEDRGRALAEVKDELKLLIQCIDLTTLAGDDTRTRVEKLTNKAVRPVDSTPDLQCGAVCVYPARVVDVVNRLKSLPNSSKVHVASVVGGFPSGQYHLESRLLETKLAVQDGANECDMVINRAAALDGDWETVRHEVSEFKRVAGNAHLKVILAVGELDTDTNIHMASIAAINGGADFIKTSTGKETVNATLRSALIMCRAIRYHFDKTGQRVGFKPAGGIRTVEEALSYRALVEEVIGKEWVNPELFRIGASSLLDAVVAKLAQ
ncbi:2-deoxy-D-ribose 5-phosphate aldolase [Aphelenchoides besseyi]|nr:2-deoxy-D-ribose 5-phosphate aldolase [Aphelenchoides besseyi]KAI6194035.1 2-deoxy-D-ribose 5-phosphate aldolase [Aphelenchoides besseyi]